MGENVRMNASMALHLLYFLHRPSAALCGVVLRFSSLQMLLRCTPKHPSGISLAVACLGKRFNLVPLMEVEVIIKLCYVLITKEDTCIALIT